MAEPTVFEMEIEGVVHPVEDKTARQTLEKLTAFQAEETLTGEIWVDGKPIYRKPVIGVLATYTDGAQRRLFNVGIVAENVSDIVRVGGSVCFNTNPASATAQFVATGSVWVNSELKPVYASNFIKSGSQVTFYGACDQNATLTKFTYKAYLEYTKIA